MESSKRSTKYPLDLNTTLYRKSPRLYEKKLDFLAGECHASKDAPAPKIKASVLPTLLP